MLLSHLVTSRKCVCLHLMPLINTVFVVRTEPRNLWCYMKVTQTKLIAIYKLGNIVLFIVTREM
jgi:hypothetical protein